MEAETLILPAGEITAFVLLIYSLLNPLLIWLEIPLERIAANKSEVYSNLQLLLAYSLLHLRHEKHKQAYSIYFEF